MVPRRGIPAVDLVAGLAALSSAVSDLGSSYPLLDRDAIGEPLQSGVSLCRG